MPLAPRSQTFADHFLNVTFKKYVVWMWHLFIYIYMCVCVCVCVCVCTRVLLLNWHGDICRALLHMSRKYKPKVLSTWTIHGWDTAIIHLNEYRISWSLHMSILIESMRSLLIQFPPPPARVLKHTEAPRSRKVRRGLPSHAFSDSFGLPHALHQHAPRPGGDLAALGRRHRPRPGVTAHLPASC